MSGKKYATSLISSTEVNGLLATGACAHSSLVRRRCHLYKSGLHQVERCQSQSESADLPPFERQIVLGACSIYRQVPKPALLSTFKFRWQDHIAKFERGSNEDLVR